MPHPLVTQLRFTRSEFFRAIKGVDEVDAQKRIMPMNCMSWNVGHLAWQEQQYFLVYGQDFLLIPEIRKGFAYGAPASTPPLNDMLAAWKTITQATDSWLDTLTSATLLVHATNKGKPIKYTYGNLLQRVIYHYWYHLGENMAIRQLLGHKQLPQFVGDIDGKAPYRAE
jgi:hypothetical protein